MALTLLKNSSMASLLVLVLAPFADGASLAVTTGVSSSLRVRLHPSDDSNVIGRLTPGEAFTVSGEDGEWYRVALTPGGSGFVARRYVSILQAIPENPAKPADDRYEQLLAKVEDLARFQTSFSDSVDELQLNLTTVDTRLVALDAVVKDLKRPRNSPKQKKWPETLFIVLITLVVGLISVNAVRYTQVANVVGRCHDRWAAIMAELNGDAAPSAGLKLRFWDLQHEQFAHFRRGLIPIQTFEFWMALRQKELTEWDWSSVAQNFSGTNFYKFMTALNESADVRVLVRWWCPSSLEVALYLMFAMDPRSRIARSTRGLVWRFREQPATKPSPPPPASPPTQAA